MPSLNDRCGELQRDYKSQFGSGRISRVTRCVSHVKRHKKISLTVIIIAQLLIVWNLREYSYFAAVNNTPSASPGNLKKAMNMNHSGHMAMTTLNPHAGHDMGGHEGHDMGGHEGHDMTGYGTDDQTDHSQHNLGAHSMHFHISYDATILFEKWSTDSWQGMLWSCTVIFIMAALYEGLKVFREYLLQKYSRAAIYEINGQQPLATSEENAVCEPRKISVGSRMCSLSHLIQTLLHIVQVVLSYFLMLIFMTYNFYLCLAVAVGAGMGYFLFSWKRSTIIDINEHCH